MHPHHAQHGLVRLPKMVTEIETRIHFTLGQKFDPVDDRRPRFEVYRQVGVARYVRADLGLVERGRSLLRSARDDRRLTYQLESGLRRRSIEPPRRRP